MIEINGYTIIINQIKFMYYKNGKLYFEFGGDTVLAVVVSDNVAAGIIDWIEKYVYRTVNVTTSKRNWHD